VPAGTRRHQRTRWRAAIASSLLIHGCALVAAQWLSVTWPRPPSGGQVPTAVTLEVALITTEEATPAFGAHADETTQPRPAADAPARTESEGTASPTAAMNASTEAGPITQQSETSSVDPPAPRADMPATLPEKASQPTAPDRQAVVTKPPMAPGRSPDTPARKKAPEPHAAAGQASPRPSPTPSPARTEPPRPPATRLSADAESRSAPAASEPSPAEPRSLDGLAALDAEIAAARKRTAPRPTSPPVDDRAIPPAVRAPATKPSGLAALDAEIAASRGRSTDTGPQRGASGAARATRPTQQRAPDEPGRAKTADAGGRGQAERRYLSALRRALERQRHYPPSARRRGLEGTARVQFTIAADGAFSGIRVSRSAGVATLDEAAEHTVRRLARFEPIPAAIGRNRWTVRVPIAFRLN
jgi:TonB family protein